VRRISEPELEAVGCGIDPRAAEQLVVRDTLQSLIDNEPEEDACKPSST
jgi:hypothetical protein